jgi:hypothetical protein
MEKAATEQPPGYELTPRELAVLAENIDSRNWLDQHTAAPDSVRAGLVLNQYWSDGLAMVSSAVPFSHFNMVLTLGCPARVDGDAFDTIERFYADSPAGRHWILVNDHSEPHNLDRQLAQRGYRQDGAWDRVVLRGACKDLWRPWASGCEIVTNDNAEDWSQFVLGCYGMPQLIAKWLHALVGRPGWIHALRREGGRSGAPAVMVRSLYQAGGWAWLGIDAPVPGVMAPRFEDDRALVATLLCEATRLGTHSFVSDVEATAPTREGPQYGYWNELGFNAAYLRRLFVKSNG